MASLSNHVMVYSRTGSQVTTRRDSQIKSRQVSTTSISLVGLPGAGTSALLDNGFNLDNIDPALFEEFLQASDDSFKVATPLSTVNVDPTLVNDDIQNGQSLDGSNDFGMNLVPVDVLHRDQPGPYGIPINTTFDATTFATQYNNSFSDSLRLSIGWPAPPQQKYSPYHPSADYDYAHPSKYAQLAHSPDHATITTDSKKTSHSYRQAPIKRLQPAGLGLEVDNSYLSRRSDRVEAEAALRTNRTRSPSYSSSEEAGPVLQRRKAHQTTVSLTEKSRPRPENPDASRRSSISSQLSDEGSDEGSVEEIVEFEPVRAGEKPKRHEDKSWVRVNSSTKGTTTRTTRINQLVEAASKYKHKPLPIGKWKSSNFKFEYIKRLNMDEFKEHAMSARQVYEYITQFPGKELRIWIQITPGDSARRYASESHSRCIFEKCPNRKWSGKSTIEVGSYRVAFDEKHKKYGKGVCDPFDCVGYAHLYCMERFLDFPAICEAADVRVDDRSGLKKEPKAIAPFTFLNTTHMNDKLVAEKFVKAAHVGALHSTHEFRHYPNHGDYARGEAKPHADTLVAALFKANLAHRNRSKIKQFVNRKILPGVFAIHHGDQEMANIDKMVAALPEYQNNVRAGVHDASEMSSYYDRFFPQVNIRIQECLDLRTKLKHEDDLFGAPTRGGSQKRRFKEVEDSTGELELANLPNTRRGNQQKKRRQGGSSPSLSQQQTRSPLRSSPRKKQRADYAPEPKRFSQQHDDHHFAQIAPLLPQYPTNPTQLDLDLSSIKGSTYFDTTPAVGRNNSYSQFFIKHPDLQSINWGHLDAISQSPSHRKPSGTLSHGPYTLSSLLTQETTPHTPLSMSLIFSQQTTPNNPISLSSIVSQQITPRIPPYTASFNAKPVSVSVSAEQEQEQKFAATHDYPLSIRQAQSKSPAVTRPVYEHQRQHRRSTRIASRADESPSSSPRSLRLTRVQAARIGKLRT